MFISFVDWLSKLKIFGSIKKILKSYVGIPERNMILKRSSNKKLRLSKVRTSNKWPI